MLTKQSAADWDYVWKDIAGGGTVTSIGLVVPAGFTASGPVTTSGDITITYTSGYQGFTTAEAVKLGTIATNADVTTSAKVGAALAGPTPSTVLNDGDKLGGILSGGAVLATWSWATIKAGIKALSDTLYATKAQGTKADTAVQPAGLTKAAVGLSSVDNTSDASKPVSTAQAAAIGLKVDKTGGTGLGGYSAAVSLTSGNITLSSTDPKNIFSHSNVGSMSITAPSGSMGLSAMITLINTGTAGPVSFIGFGNRVKGDTISTTPGKVYVISVGYSGSNPFALIAEFD